MLDFSDAMLIQGVLVLLDTFSRFEPVRSSTCPTPSSPKSFAGAGHRSLIRGFA